jgi:hypothetical protein
VEEQQCLQLTGTNCSNGLIILIITVHGNSRKTCASICLSPAWWLWRGVHTRSHPELGRKSPQRQWYFVLRRGRVGRRQACKRQIASFTDTENPPLQKCTAGFVFFADVFLFIADCSDLVYGLNSGVR